MREFPLKSKYWSFTKAWKMFAGSTGPDKELKLKSSNCSWVKLWRLLGMEPWKEL